MLGGFHLSWGSVPQSFEIRPDITAQGTAVWSSIPPWAPGGATGYGSDDGTSMVAPHIAGAAALLIDYSRRNCGQWSANEIKVRLMNTAFPMVEGLFGNTPANAFGVGAGYADVYAAAFTDTVVSVRYDRVVTNVHLSFYNQNFATTQTG